MAKKRKFTGKDSAQWKVVGYDGKTLTKNGKPLKGYDGFAQANNVARFIPGAVAIRH